MDQATKQVVAATTPKGILASTESVANYQRVWARDSVISGIAGLMAQEEKIIEGLYHSLELLGAHQAPEGNIPSNVELDDQGNTTKVSYGGLCGRVDANTWWIIGLGLYCKNQNDNQLLDRFRYGIEKCLRLLQAWEFNNRGLIYVPQSGNWADEYILQGYTLYDQVLYYWALQLAGDLLNNKKWLQKAVATKSLIRHNFWIDRNSETSIYHPNAFARKFAEDGPSKYFEACLSPGGYIKKFDLLGNALAIILNISNSEQEAAIFDHAATLSIYKNQALFPSFSPVIKEEDPEWFLLAANYAYEFRNYPYQFQNAGIWPAFNAWFGAAQFLTGRKEKSQELYQSLIKANAQEQWGFYECLNGETGEVHGTKCCTWSAAGLLLLGKMQEGKQIKWK